MMRAALPALLLAGATAFAQPTQFASDRVATAIEPTLTSDDVRKLVDEKLAERDRKAKETSLDQRKVTGKWNNGLTFETDDKAFRLTVGGVNQFDVGGYSANEAQKRSIGTFNNLVDPGQTLQDGMSFRRARLRMSGLAYEQVEFFAQYEFANAVDLRQRSLGLDPAGGSAYNFDPANAVGFNEVYIGLVHLPVVGTFRVGRHRESLNFVTATADNNQVWMERGLLFEAFNGDYNFSQGITASRTYLDDRVYSLVGVFMQNNGARQFGAVGDGKYVYDARLTALPLWDEEQQLWAHIGFDYSYRNLYQDAVRYRTRPAVRVGTAFQVPSLTDSGSLLSKDAQQIANLELAMAWGPWTAAAEATVSHVTNAFTGGLPRADGTLPAGATSRGRYDAAGGYVEVLRFLTEDHRPYVKERPGYGRVVPTKRFRCAEDEEEWSFDAGAWEVGLRYDYADLTNAGVNGGTVQGVTAALNWYLTSNARVQINYAWMTRSFNPNDVAGRLPGELRAIGVRFNCDF